MALPKNVTFVTFDVYGTLIDWETGAYEAFRAEAERDGFTIERDELIPLFYEIQRQIQARILIQMPSPRRHANPGQLRIPSPRWHSSLSPRWHSSPSPRWNPNGSRRVR